MFGRAPARNRRASSSRQRRKEHLLEVKVRHSKAVQQRNRAIFTWLTRLLLLALVVGGSAYGIREGLRRFLWENPEYQIAQVTVATNGTLTRDEILQTTGVAEGMNIFRVNLSSARTKLTAIPQVEMAELERMLPNRIDIKIVERTPVAWLTREFSEDPSTSKQAMLLDSKGIAMSTKRVLPEYYHLPVICGVNTDEFVPGQVITQAEVHSALELLHLNSDNVRFQVRAVDLSRGYCMLVTDRTHAQITFGLDNIARQLDRLNAVLNYVEESKREIQTVNLLVERNIPVTFANPNGEEQPIAEATTPSSATNSGDKSAKKPDSTAKKSEPTKKSDTNSKKSDTVARKSESSSKKSDSSPRKSDSSSRKSDPEPKVAKVVKRAEPVQQKQPSFDPDKPVMRAEPVRRAIPLTFRSTSNQNG